MFEIRIPSDLAARYRQLTGQAPSPPTPEVMGARPAGGTTVYVPPASAVAALSRIGTAGFQASPPANAAATLNLLQTQAVAEQSSAPELVLALKQAIFTALDANGTMTRSEVAQMYAAADESDSDELDPEADPEDTGEVAVDQPMETDQVSGDDVTDEMPMDEMPVDEVTEDAGTVTDTPVTDVPVDEVTSPTSPTSPTVTLAPTAQDALNAIMTSVEASADPATRLKQAIFHHVDTTGEGVVTAATLEQAVTAAGGSAFSAAFLYAQLDPAGAGTVSSQQFSANFDFNQLVDVGVGVPIAMPSMEAVATLSQAVSIPPMSSPSGSPSPFSAVDTDNDGVATQAEVEHAVMASGGSADSASALFAHLDPEGAGSVAANQFYANMPAPVISYYDSFFGVTIDSGPPTDAQRGMEAVYQTMATESDPVRQFTRGLFEKLDADADGALTQAEVEQSVVAAGSTAEAGGALYTQLDPENAGSISEQQFIAGLPRPNLSAERAMALSNALRPIPSAPGSQLAQSSAVRTAGALSTSMMSVLLQAQSST